MHRTTTEVTAAAVPAVLGTPAVSALRADKENAACTDTPFLIRMHGGSVRYAREAITALVMLCAAKLPSLTDFETAREARLYGRLRSVRDVSGSSLHVRLSVVAGLSKPLVALARNLQAAVQFNIENMTGLAVMDEQAKRGED